MSDHLTHFLHRFFIQSLSLTLCVSLSITFFPTLTSVRSLFSNNFKEEGKNVHKKPIQQCQNNYKLFHNLKRHFHQKKNFRSQTADCASVPKILKNGYRKMDKGRSREREIESIFWIE